MKFKFICSMMSHTEYVTVSIFYNYNDLLSFIEAYIILLIFKGY